MAKMSRPLVTMMIRPQAKMDTQTKMRKIFCTTPPSTSWTMNATGAELADAALTELVAYVRAMRNAKPATPEASTARIIALGIVLCGSNVSSARLLADSNPTIVYAPSRVASINGPSQA